MAWTPLHAALGATNTDLTFDLIAQACAEGVREREELDWKRRLPLTAGPDDREHRQRQQDELAKDIAAMANSGGGMIVYGVAETDTPGESAADHIEPVGPVDEITMQNIRRVAGNVISPPVTGLQLTPLAPSDNPEGGVLVLVIPDSPDQPHLIRPPKGRDWFACPQRHGPDTEWMSERQLARAYTTRETARRTREANFDQRFNSFLHGLEPVPDLRWVVAFASPETPARAPRVITPRRADIIFERAWRQPWVDACLPPSALGIRNLTVHEGTRRGLRRHLRTGTQDLGAAKARAKVEIHEDGTVAAAFTRDGYLAPSNRQPTQVPIADIERLAMEFFALLWDTHTATGNTGTYAARLTVHPPTEIFRTNSNTMSDHYHDWNGRRVHNYTPVDGPVLTNEGFESALTTWIDVARDAVNQAGSQTVLDAQQVTTTIQLSD